MQDKTAILVFANSAREETKHKPIPGGEALFNGLTAHTLKTVKKTKLPYFHFTEQQQMGDSFGERFLNAIKWVFDQGYQNVITIGNDTPQLTTNIILSTHSQLVDNKIVIGPSYDGGFYLMGFHKSLFKTIKYQQFKNLPWKTASLYKALNNLLKLQNRETVSLPTLLDLDNLRDIKKLTDQNPPIPQRLLEILLSILRTFVEKINNPPQLTEVYFLDYYYNKGSPIPNLSEI